MDSWDGQRTHGLFNVLLAILADSKQKPEVRDCAPAGGRGVIEGLGKQLSLPDSLLEPSFASLFWYGNTSSASVWYALGFIEAARSLSRGDVVWQVCASWGSCEVVHVFLRMQERRISIQMRLAEL